MKQDLESVLTEYGPLLGRVAASYEINPALRQELMQEMCVAVWQSLQRFEGKSSLKTYILRVAHNKGVDHVAYHAKQPGSESISEDEQAVSEQSTPHSQVLREQQIDRLVSAVQALPIQQRQVVTLSMEGLDYQEIAEVCGLSKSNVGVILNRARKVLTHHIKDNE